MLLFLLFASFLFHLLVRIDAEWCGNNRVPFGLEVHKNGHANILCSRPNCFDKKYADCDERPIRQRCRGNSSWVGGFEKPVGGSLRLQCCVYDDLALYSEVLFPRVLVRAGEYFEGEEKMDEAEEDVLAFDYISNLRTVREPNGTAWWLEVSRFHCGKVVSTKPVWKQSRSWPYFDNDLILSKGF